MVGVASWGSEYADDFFSYKLQHIYAAKDTTRRHKNSARYDKTTIGEQKSVKSLSYDGNRSSIIKMLVVVLYSIIFLPILHVISSLWHLCSSLPAPVLVEPSRYWRQADITFLKIVSNKLYFVMADNPAIRKFVFHFLMITITRVQNVR